MATPGSRERKQLAVIYNPIKVTLPKLRTAVNAAVKAADWATPIWFSTTEEDAGQRVTASAIRRGADVILVAGGDGTVRAVASALRNSDVAMAVVPSGTGNLLARNLGLSLNSLEQAIDVAINGIDHAIDLGHAEIVREDGGKEEHVFLVMAGLGIDAKMIANTNDDLKKAVGWLAYVDGTIRSIPQLKPVKLYYRLNKGSEKSMHVQTIIVGNCGSLPGGILLIPDAQPDDGILDIVALRPRGPFGWLRIWNKVTFENGVLSKSAAGRKIIDFTPDVPDVTYLRGRTIDLRVEEPQGFQIDGDEFGVVRSVHTRLDEGSLLVRLPAPS